MKEITQPNRLGSDPNSHYSQSVSVRGMIGGRNPAGSERSAGLFDHSLQVKVNSLAPVKGVRLSRDAMKGTEGLEPREKLGRDRDGGFDSIMWT